MTPAKRILHEPLLQFLVLGVILYLLNTWAEDRSHTTRITIARQQIARISDQYRRQFGTAPSQEQLDGLIDKAITEEIYYRQAIKLGLDKDDEIVRRRLVQKYEFLQQDLAVPDAPTPAQLRQFHLENASRYRLPERITFTHVYFSPDHRGDAGARAAAAALGEQLTARGATRAANQGDTYPGPNDFSAASREELQRVFGQEGLASDVFGIDVNRWSKPLHSGFGWHTVYVTGHQTSRIADFDEVREQVRRDYRQAANDRRNADAYATLRRQFDIVRE